MNVVDPILFQSRINPDNVAICTPGAGRDSITYGELERQLNNVGRKALSLGLERGHVVAVTIQDTILHATLVLGLARLGIATTSGWDDSLTKAVRLDAFITDKPEHSNGHRVMLA